jgi:RNA polymerase sigma-54 factor
MLKHELQIKLQQKLSPLQIQVIKMLEYPTIEMENRIREELEINPALEAVTEQDETSEYDLNQNLDEDGNEITIDSFDLTDAPDDETPDYKLHIDNGYDETMTDIVPFSGDKTFQEYLKEQLKLLHITEEERSLAEYLIGNIDEDGYLRRSVAAMVDDLSFQLGMIVSPEQIQEALDAVQTLDPAGVGARTLQECLLLQLKRKEQTPVTDLALTVVSSYFSLFTRKQYETLTNRLNVSEKAFREVIDEILRLNPKPGNAFATVAESIITRITPDFILEEDNNGKLYVTLNNSNIPELRVNTRYYEMVRDFIGNKNNRSRQARDAIIYAKQKIDAAKWFVDAVRQRNNTLLSTMNVILAAQYDFFLTGDDTTLKPLKLKDVAAVTGFDISTVSRVSSSKYVQTAFGIYPLKHFYSETMQMYDGEKVSNKEIKQILYDILQAEDKSRPVTDDELTEILREMGYVIARRTVSKYREQLDIPIARLRIK